MSGVSMINKSIIFVCAIGVQLSLYAYVIETNKEHDKDYVAICDISEHMSCTKAFTSPYGKGFGLIRHILGEDSALNQPNSIAGMIFYCLLAGLCAFNTVSAAKWQVGLSILSNIGSLYLAYILYFVLYDFCIICVSTYIVNAINLILTIMKLEKVRQQQKPKHKGAIKKKN